MFCAHFLLEMINHLLLLIHLKYLHIIYPLQNPNNDIVIVNGNKYTVDKSFFNANVYIEK